LQVTVIVSRLRRRLRRYLDMLGPERQLEQVAPLSADELARIQRHFRRPKFFVSGYPRSGTTLLARLVRLHPQVECRWQAHIASDERDLLSVVATSELQSWLTRPSNRWVGEADLLPAIVRLAADYVLERDLTDDIQLVGDKTPAVGLERAIDRLVRLYPEAKLVLIIRDGRDAVLSQRIQAFLDQPETLALTDMRLRHDFLETPASYGQAGRSLFSEAWLGRVAGAWNQAVTAGMEMAQRSYGDRCLSLRYEDLLTDPWGSLARLWDFLGAGDPPARLQPAVVEALGRNPAAEWHAQLAPALSDRLKRGEAGGWQDWFTAANRQLFEERAAVGLRRWSYL